MLVIFPSLPSLAYKLPSLAVSSGFPQTDLRIVEPRDRSHAPGRLLLTQVSRHLSLAFSQMSAVSLRLLAGGLCLWPFCRTGVAVAIERFLNWADKVESLEAPGVAAWLCVACVLFYKNRFVPPVSGETLYVCREIFTCQELRFIGQESGKERPLAKSCCSCVPCTLSACWKGQPVGAGCS